MEGIQIDWLVVLIAAILNMVIGAVWYSRLLFGKLWLEWTQLKAEEIQGKKSAFVYGFVISWITAFFLAFFEGYLGVTTVSDGMFVGFCLWLGFVATTQISLVIWGRRSSWRLFFLDTGYKLLSFLVMSGIIGA